MKKIIVASKNPVKINAIREGFMAMFPDEEFDVVGIDVPSGVADQPMSDEETYRGASNRVTGALQQIPDADFWAGLEGGVAEQDGELSAFAWIIIRSKDGRMGKGKTSTFFLPSKMAELIRQGKEMGHASDELFGKHNSKHDQGSIGLLTNGIIDRTKYYTQPVIEALIPFKNSEFY